MKSFSLKELGQLLGAEVRGDDSVTVSSVATLEKARPDQITFLANTKYRSQLEQTQAGAVLISPKELDGFAGNALVLNDPYVGFARVAQLLDSTPVAAEDIHPSAQIHPSAKLGEGVAVGANAVIGANSILGENVQIGAGTVVGQDVIIAQAAACGPMSPSITMYIWGKTVSFTLGPLSAPMVSVMPTNAVSGSKSLRPVVCA